MAFRKINGDELVGKGNIGKPDTPGVSTSEMQRILDEIPREVIVPAFNELSDQLVSPSASGSLGANAPQSLPPETSHTVQGVLNAICTRAEEGFEGANNALKAHTSRTDNPHHVTAEQAGAYTKEETDDKISSSVSEHSNNKNNPHVVTAAQTGAYTKEETDAAISQRVAEIGAGDMAKAVYDPQSQGRDVTVQTYTHTKSGTVHNFAGSGANGRAKMTANVQAGDTFTVNGAPATAYMGAESAAAAMAGSAWNGRWVSFVVDGATLNFKGGGGKVTVSGLSAAAVKTGATVTVKQGAKTVQTVTGTFTNDGNIYNSAVLENLVGYSKGQRIVGTIPNRSSTIIRIPLNGPDANVGGYIVWGNGIAVVPAVGYYGGYSHLTRRLEISGPELASAVGLTPAVLKAGTTVLGVAGSYKGVPCLCYASIYTYPDNWNGTKVALTSFDASFIDSGNISKGNNEEAVMIIKRPASIKIYFSGAGNNDFNAIPIYINGNPAPNGGTVLVSANTKISVKYVDPGSNRARGGAFCIFENA